MRRREVLELATEYVTKDRAADHGKPEDTFQAIADLWNGYLGGENLDSQDVALMMVLLKVARAQMNPKHDDNYVDIAGYAACASELANPPETSVRPNLGSEEKEQADRAVRLEHSGEIIYRVHDPAKCAGQPCTIHNRSDHSMRAFPQHWREDRGIMERTCPHGIGHPDPDSPWVRGSAEWVHGCCAERCCAA